MDKQEINKAITKVISSKYKKDCKESAIMLKNNGYFIEKSTGEKFYRVYSYKTFKCVYISLRANYKINMVNKEFTTYEELLSKLKKIDFVAYLGKPSNSTWNDLEHKRFKEKHGFATNQKIETFKFLKEKIKSKKGEIEYVKEQINYYIGKLTEYATELEKLECSKRELL